MPHKAPLPFDRKTRIMQNTFGDASKVQKNQVVGKKTSAILIMNT